MIKLVHHEMVINSKFLEVPRSYYQRHLNASRVKRIAAEFDERIANAPNCSIKLLFRHRCRTGATCVSLEQDGRNVLHRPSSGYDCSP